MSISSRIHDTIENWQAEWKDRLAGWLTSVIISGSIKLMDELEETAKPPAQEFIDRFPMPPEMKAELEAYITKPGAIHLPAFAVMAIGVVIGSLIGTFMGWAAPIARWTSYVGDKILKTTRLDPMAVITAWRRDPETYAHLFDDLKDQGWSDERIEALKFFTLYYPAPADLIRWQAREVFEPEMIARYGLDDEFEAIDLEPFRKAGMTDEQTLNFWRAHWEHASWMQVVEMLHRGLLTEEQVYDWFRVVEIPPFWRDLLIQTAYTWPTRVDVRRWWDMRTIDETELRRLYSGMGYRGVNLDNYVLWTKVYVAFPDLIARWTKGWITLDEVRSQLTALGMPADRVEEMIQMKIKPEETERIASERDVTKTDIYKGVKQGVITRGEAIDLLMDLGFDEDEADYLLAINIPPDEEVKVVAQRALTKADILSGLKTAVITRGEARTKLLDLRYSTADAEFLLKIYDAQVSPPVEPKLREASKADIVLGVTKGLIDQSEAYAMLLDLGFTPEASGFILMVKTEESPFSPINFAEFKDLTQKYRLAAGMEAKPMPEELKKAAAEVVRLTGEVEALERSIEEEKRGLIEGEVLPEETTARLTELEVARNRAISELERVKSEYNSKLAEWRHG